MSIPFERLVKSLELTKSVHDGEALPAVRHANWISTELGLMSADLVQKPATSRPHQQPRGDDREGSAAESDYGEVQDA
ncbi:hypothetical protein [Azospirillum argentinense]|uniref:hypothetical protein n=1 Tax=Azospirillum argentinense TaxID=2970906 RepID=UPI001185CB58|nr:hypothetical protein [Azospirillum argentinense]